MTRFELEFPGDPMPMPRAQRNGRQTYMPKPYMAYRDALSVTMIASRKGRPAFAAGTPVELYAEFHRSSFHRVDLDNMLKTVLDAMNAGCWVDDDSQVCRIETQMWLGVEKPRTMLQLSMFGTGRRSIERDLRVVVRDQATYIRTLEEQLKPLLQQPPVVVEQDSLL